MAAKRGSFRLVGLSAAVGIATLFAVACGDTNVTNIVVAADGGADDARVGVEVDAGDGAVADAWADSGVEDAGADASDGSICNDVPTGPASTDCTAVALCPSTLQCAAGPEATFYTCSDGGHPALAKCYSATAPGTGAGSCCELSCVRASGQDSRCGGGTTAYSCPTNGSSGELAVAPPSGACGAPMATANPFNSYVCCP